MTLTAQKIKVLQVKNLIGATGMIKDGDWVESKDQDPGGEVRLIQLADIDSGRFVDRSARFLTMETATRLKCTFLKPGDLLISRLLDPLSHVCVFPGDSKPCVSVVDVCILRPDTSLIDSQWLKWVFNAPDFQAQVQRFSSGSTRKRISRKNLESLSVAVPSLEEQQRVAIILDKVEAITAKRRKSVNILKTLTQSIFLHYFSETIRSGTRKTLRELVHEFRYGTSVKSGEVGYPVLRIPNIVSGAIRSEDLKFVDLDDATFERIKLLQGDLLFVRTNGNPDNVGRCAVFEPSDFSQTKLDPEAFVFASYLIRARVREELILPTFLQQYFESQEGRIALRSGSKTSAGQFNINTQSLGSMPIPLPSLNLQRKFVENIRTVQQLQMKAVVSLHDAEKLFVSLQSQLFADSAAINGLKLDV